jgi:LPS O-antigen subunit length determinant protein (WzzB/FepE family)
MSLYEGNMTLMMAKVNKVNVETPIRLVSRLKYPTSYNEDVVVSCGFPPEIDSYKKLSELIKPTISSGSSAHVSVSVRLSSQDLSQKCLESFFEMIKSQQQEMKEKLIAADKYKVIKYGELLEETRKQMNRNASEINKKQVVNYSLQKEIFTTERDIINLQTNLLANTDTEVSVPIFVSPQPVYPNKAIAFVYGALLGLMVGILAVLVKSALWKENNGR